MTEQNPWRFLWNVSFFVVVFSSAPMELNKNHPWVKGIRVCSNEGPRPVPKGTTSDTVEMH